MPIKFSKGFARRKSSINALEEVEGVVPEPSFRVIERTPEASKSFDGGHVLKRKNQGRPLSAGHHPDGRPYVERPDLRPSNRGSGGTQTSSSSGGAYDDHSSSARFSSSSTLPSTSDVTFDEYLKNQRDRSLPATPESQPVTFLRAAGKTFSFGKKVPRSALVPALVSELSDTAEEVSGSRDIHRSRAMTDSSYASASTATPPKLLATDLDLGVSDLDGFSNMFQDYGRRSQLIEAQGANVDLSKISSSQEPVFSGPSAVETYNTRTGFQHTPLSPSIPANRGGDISQSTGAKHRSHGNLVAVADIPRHTSDFIDYNESPPVPHHRQALQLSGSNPKSNTESPTESMRFQRKGSSDILRRASTPLQDEDARLLIESVYASRRINETPGEQSQYVYREPSPGSPYGSFDAPHKTTMGSAMPSKDVDTKSSSQTRPTPVALFDSEDPLVSESTENSRAQSTETTPRARKILPARKEESAVYNPSFTVSIQSASQYEEQKGQDRLPIRKAPQGKVMTPAQFERYRRDHEMSHSRSPGDRSDLSDEENDNYDDDDDKADHHRELVKQRRKQEAQLAVYRQKMMKVTGEQPSDLLPSGQMRPKLDRTSLSTPNLLHSSPSASPGKDRAGGEGGEDEDDDIPLGILAAHGFPSKSRPPTAMSTLGSTPNIRYVSETYPPPPPPPISTAGEAANTRPRSALPVFARNLPQDPYYGASLVSPSNRESLAFGNSHGDGSVHGGPPTRLPPGGLVGVIAGEERAKALRRGSPNAQGGFGSTSDLAGDGIAHIHPGMGRSMTMGASGMVPPGMMMPHPDQAQIQMSQQLNQMMQMQAQWMQQMQQIMQGQAPQFDQQPGPPLPPPHLGQHSDPPLPPPHQQPQQLLGNNSLSPMPRGPLQRPMSVGNHITPSQLNQNQRAMSMLGPGVAPPWPQQPSLHSSLGASKTMSGALGESGPGYAPSIAPSERSNIGMPPRYRPVSVAAMEEEKGQSKSSRTSTLTTGESLGFGDKQSGTGAAVTVRAINGGLMKKSKKGGGNGGSDDDDEEGWEDMKKQRAVKQSSWRLRKKEDPNAGLGDLYYGTGEY